MLDLLQLPAVTAADIAETIARLPLVAPPVIGQEVDGFAIKALVSEGRYSRLFAASNLVEGGDVVMKFPKPQTASAETHRQAFLREQWAGSTVQNPWVGRVVELAAGRQTCLYTVMPLYEGELLETRPCAGRNWNWNRRAPSACGWRAGPPPCIAPASFIATSSPTM